MILYGFAFVALPLVAALALAVASIDRLSYQSQDAVYRAAQATRDSRILSGQITAMERHARQYLVLRDPVLLNAYRDTRAGFLETAAKLLELTRGTPQATLLGDLLQREQKLQQQIERALNADDSAGVAEGIASEFAELARQADAILTGSSRLIDEEVQAMEQEAGRAQSLVVGLAFALVPLSLLSVAVFTALIAQPIRQLGRAIRQLGAGDLGQAIHVSGPHDLRALGAHLDWLRERLRELEEQKTRFLQHISHELKTPLTAIRESVDLISERAVGPLNAQQAEIAQILRSNARELQSLIEDLLNFGTARNHGMTLQLSHLDPREIIEQIAQNHKPTLISKDIQLDMRLEALSIDADAEKLAVMVDNLFSNAVKFTPPGGTIQVLLAERAGQIELSVTDSGPGVPEEEREQIFEAFFQGRQRPEGYVQGSGLGLSIAQEYAVAHGGRIIVADHDGEGARFQIQLPRQNERSKKANA